MKINANKILLAIWFAFLLTLLAMFWSCKPTSVIQETTKEIKKDSLNNSLVVNSSTEISREIIDSIVKNIPKIQTGSVDCDSICNLKVDELLEQINFYKKSGQNQYQLFYDKEKRYLTIQAKMAETINKLKDSVKIEYKEKIKIVETAKEIPVKFIPKWIQILAFLGGLFILFLIYRFSKIFT